jgi:putative Holliday junction resolvase
MSSKAEARTLLAFDFGLKRIGVAVGEPQLGIAHPLPAIVASGSARFTAVEKLLAEWRPAGLVVGVPLSTQGVPHLVTRQAERFARQLEGRYRLPVARVDERYTSVEAESRLRGLKKKAIDSVAAQLILEQYMHEHAA